MDNPDSVLDELMALEKEVKPALKRIGEIRDWCRKMGTFSTERYVCAVLDKEQRRLIGLEAAALALGGVDIVEELGLIQIIEFKTIHVSRR